MKTFSRAAFKLIILHIKCKVYRKNSSYYCYACPTVLLLLYSSYYYYTWPTVLLLLFRSYYFLIYLLYCPTKTVLLLLSYVLQSYSYCTRCTAIYNCPTTTITVLLLLQLPYYYYNCPTTSITTLKSYYYYNFPANTTTITVLLLL